MHFYFLLSPYGGPEKANYQHACVVLAEGLKSLQILFNSNINYYPDPSGTYLFEMGTSTPHSYIVTSAPEEFAHVLKTNKNKLIILDTKDEWIRPKSTAFIPQVHRYFMSSCCQETQVVKPWCFAASNRMLNITEHNNQHQTEWQERSDRIVWAHRVTNHALRNHALNFYKRTYTPLDTYLDNFKQPQESAAHHEWQHTGRRHSPDYFNYLSQHKYLDAHGGYPTSSHQRIVQWDSWKLWEGFLSGNLVITADLDYYNILLPFKLIPFKHYIPIRYHEMDKSYEKFFSLPDTEKEAIAREGAKFVREHFNPTSMAQYMLSML